ncbi:LacI family DNA-binding transcriptional regulator [Arthrobacter sp. NPDC056493]|uniref:LacI family DNA-binding transcriptional regulator n=1 Tax=Arthrobacter sp. NPDC056493 TaxID=3345839 RepID=UPI003670344A
MVKSSSAAGAKVTIYDIAKLAGVNASTVSRALGNPGRVSDKTRKLVEHAAAELNFSINPLARALPTGRTGMVGLIVADITNPGYFDIIRGAQSAAAALGLTLVLAESSESGSTEVVVARRMQSSTDAIILATPRMSDPEIRALSGTKPVAVINRCVDGVDSVVPDVQPGIGEAVRHLASNGHQKIAFLSGSAQSWMSARRWDSFRSACDWTGREAQLIATTAPTAEGGRLAARDVIASGATAALCYNDLLAIGLMQELQAAKVNLPDEFSVVGFDNIFGSDFTTPALTTIASPFKDCGAAALGLLLAALPGAGLGPAPVRTVGPMDLRTTLVVRGSSGRLLTPAI